MKKHLIRIMTVLMTMAILCAPVTVFADSMFAAATATVGGSVAPVLPVTLNENTIPLLGIPANLSREDMIQAFAAKLNSPRVARGLGFYEHRRGYNNMDFVDRGTCIIWDFGECSFKGFRGTALLRYCTPTDANPDYADDTPYYEFIFKPAADGPRVMIDGCHERSDLAFALTMSSLAWRIPELDYVHGLGWYAERANGDVFIIDIDLNYSYGMNYQFVLANQPLR